MTAQRQDPAYRPAKGAASRERGRFYLALSAAASATAGRAALGRRCAEVLASITAVRCGLGYGRPRRVPPSLCRGPRGRGVHFAGKNPPQDRKRKPPEPPNWLPRLHRG